MPPFIGYEDLSGVFICGSLFDCRGRSPPTGSILLYYSIHSLKKSRKEMASLGENGQEYKCPFFKSAGQMLQQTSLKNTLLA